MSSKKQRMRDLELPAYMRALAAEREARSQEFSAAMLEQADNADWLDTLAAALGICTASDDWWDSVTADKRAKILGRISVLRGLRQQFERTVIE